MPPKPYLGQQRTVRIASSQRPTPGMTVPSALPPRSAAAGLAAARPAGGGQLASFLSSFGGAGSAGMPAGAAGYAAASGVPYGGGAAGVGAYGTRMGAPPMMVSGGVGGPGGGVVGVPRSLPFMPPQHPYQPRDYPTSFQQQHLPPGADIPITATSPLFAYGGAAGSAARLSPESGMQLLGLVLLAVGGAIGIVWRMFQSRESALRSELNALSASARVHREQVEASVLQHIDAGDLELDDEFARVQRISSEDEAYSLLRMRHEKRYRAIVSATERGSPVWNLLRAIHAWKARRRAGGAAEAPAGTGEDRRAAMRMLARALAERAELDAPPGPRDVHRAPPT